MTDFYTIALGCILLTTWAGTVLTRGEVSFAVCLALVAVGAVAVTLPLGQLEARVITVNFVALAFPTFLALGGTRFLRQRLRPVIRFALGTIAGILALSASGYLGLIVSCLWGVCL